MAATGISTPVTKVRHTTLTLRAKTAELELLMNPNPRLR